MPELPGWRIVADHTSPFVRTFLAYPDSPETTTEDYPTQERHGQRYIDVVYPARVVVVRIRHQWDEKQGAWWSSADRDLRLINEDTGHRYKTGWKAEILRPRDEKVPAPYLFDLIEATHPRTIVTVTEVSEVVA